MPFITAPHGFERLTRGRFWPAIVLGCFWLGAPSAFAQKVEQVVAGEKFAGYPALTSPMRGALPPTQIGERIFVIVPMVGKGTFDDPIRPALVPRRNANASLAEQRVEAERTAKREGILGYSYVLSDDGKMALVQLAAADSAGFEAVKRELPSVAAAEARTKMFEAGKDGPNDIETTFKAYKRDFSLAEFVRRQGVAVH